MEEKPQKELLKRRTRAFGVAAIRAVALLPNTVAAKEIGRQFIRSACSAGSNYRAAQRARSTADLIAKYKIVEEELDESLHWMEVLVEAEITNKGALKAIYVEGDELLSIVVAAIKTLRAKDGRVSESRAHYGNGLDPLFD